MEEEPAAAAAAPAEESLRPVLPQATRELYFAVAQFLAGGPCSEAAAALRREIGSHGLQLERTDWKGKQHALTTEQTQKRYSHVNGSFLGALTELSCRALGDKSPTGVPVDSILRPPPHTAVRNAPGGAAAAAAAPAPDTGVLRVALHKQRAGGMVGATRVPNLSRRPLWGKLHELYQLSGHHGLPCYCIAFDPSGDRIVTGADDHLVKVWSARTGVLLATLRGHAAEITDLAINAEGTLLASSDVAGVIRVWSLDSGMQVCNLLGHNGEIATIDFGPSPAGAQRYLVSTGKDSTIRFWHWSANERRGGVPKFDTYDATRECDLQLDIRREEGRCSCCKRGSPQTCRVVCGAFSPGGLLFATGATDGVIRITRLGGDLPIVEAVLDEHGAEVECIAFNHAGDRLLTGGQKGRVIVWSHLSRWVPLDMELLERHQVSRPPTTSACCWTRDDRHAVGAVERPTGLPGTDPEYDILVWDVATGGGKLVHAMQLHTLAVQELLPHPHDPRIVLSAATDARAVVWDVVAGVCLREIVVRFKMQNSPLDILCCCWAPNGRAFAVSDLYGQWSMYGFEDPSTYSSVPMEQYFKTDRAEVVRDAREFVLDHNTQMAPHIMDQILCSFSGTVYPDHLQRHQSSAASLVREVDARSRLISAATRLAAAEGEEEAYRQAKTLPQTMQFDSGIGTRKRHESAAEARAETSAGGGRRQASAGRQSSRTRSSNVTYIEVSDEFDSDGRSVEGWESDVSEWTAQQIRQRRRREKSQRQREERARRRAARDAGRYAEDSEDTLEETTEEDDDIMSVSSSGSARQRRRKGKRKGKKSDTERALRKYMPSDWISMLEPLPAPFVPQIQDEVMYFFQGHAEYCSATGQTRRGQQPWTKFEGLRPAELCSIEKIDYVVGPPSECVLVLSIVDNERHRGQKMSVRFRDQDNVLDFLVLRSRYDVAMERGWAPGMQFSSYVDGVWYPGTILRKHPLDEDHAESPWKCLLVAWESNDPPELTCPWELELPTLNVSPSKRIATRHYVEPSDDSTPAGEAKLAENGAAAAAAEEGGPGAPALMVIEAIESNGVPPIHGSTAGDAESATVPLPTPVPAPPALASAADRAPSVGANGILARGVRESIPAHRRTELLDTISAVSRMPIARLFRYRVNFGQFPDYLREIAYPMDLKTVRIRLKNNFYRRESALLWDVAQIARNAAIFNGEDDPVACDAQDILTALQRFVEDNLDPIVPLSRVYGADLDADSAAESDREVIVSKENDTVARLIPDAERATLFVEINRKVYPGLTLHAKLQAGTTLRGPTAFEVVNGLISADEDEPRALKERYYAIDDETPAQIAQKLEVSIAALCQVNAPVYAGFKKNAKLEEGTAVLVPLVAKRRPSDLQPETMGQAPSADGAGPAMSDPRSRRPPKRGPREQGTERTKAKRKVSGKARKREALSSAGATAARLRFTKPIMSSKSWADIAKAIHFQVMASPSAEWFRQPVDLTKFTDYLQYVDHPIDLGTIRLKLELLQYDEVREYLADMELLLANAEKYNEEDEGVLTIVADLRETVELAMGRLKSGPAAVFPYHDKDVIDSRLNEKLTTVHVSLMSMEDAVAFNEPVSRDEFPDYYVAIALPIDLGTIHTQLMDQGYRVLAKYVSEVLRVFSNAREFNEFGSGIYVAADMLEVRFRIALWHLTGDPSLLTYTTSGVAAITISRAVRDQLVEIHEKVRSDCPRMCKSVPH